MLSKAAKGALLKVGVFVAFAGVVTWVFTHRQSITKKGQEMASKVDINAPLAKIDPAKQNNKVNVRINVWPGVCPGLVANGGLTTQPQSIYANQGLDVTFKVIDDWTEGSVAMATGNVDIMLTTTDVWAKDEAQFKEKGFSAHAFYLVDKSRGADGVGAGPGMKTLEDLAGKKIGFAPGTPSEFLLWNGLKNSGLPTTKRQELINGAVHFKDGIEPAVAFAQGKLDAFVGWEPDMSDCIAKRPGSTKIFDTRVASNLIADILVVSDKFAAQNPDTVVKFVRGWLQGVRMIKEKPTMAASIIGNVKEMNMPADLAKTILEGVHLCDYTENLAYFGDQSEGTDYCMVFRSSQEMYKESRRIKTLSNPTITSDIRYLNALGEEFSKTSTEAQIEYKAPAKGQTAFATQNRMIFFASGKADILPESFPIVDEVVSFLKTWPNTVIALEGNTDSTGPKDVNVRLSKARAQAFKDAVVRKGISPSRIPTVIGNGPSKPVADNTTDEGRERNRRTDVKVYANQ